MEENNEVFETEETVEEPVEEEVEEETAETEDDWGDDSDGEEDGSDWLLDESEDTEEPETETEEQGEDTTESADDSKPEEGNQLFKIKRLGKEEELTLEQMTEYAQKGFDYDFIRQDRDRLRTEGERRDSFLKDLADRAGLSIDEQIDRTRALWLMNDEYDKGNEISESEALLRVQREHGKTSEQHQEQEDNDVNNMIDKFLKEYPEVQASDIPSEVWAKAKETNDLLSAYQAYEIKTLKAEIEKQKQEVRNTKNKNRSTGPLKSAGANRQKDDFLDGWDS